MSTHESMLPVPASHLEMLGEATREYELAALAADEYLQGRGIDPATRARFRLGVVANPLPGHERFRGFLAIPYLGHDGRVLSMRFRCVEDHDHREYRHGKYMGMPDEPVRLFNVGGIHAAGDEIAVAEGELDAVVLNRVLPFPAVGVPGAQSWKAHYRSVFAGFNRVWVFGDPDEAGAELVGRIVKALPSQARQVRLRAGDVTDTFVQGGADALLGALDAAR